MCSVFTAYFNSTLIFSCLLVCEICIITSAESNQLFLTESFTSAASWEGGQHRHGPSWCMWATRGGCWQQRRSTASPGACWDWSCLWPWYRNPCRSVWGTLLVPWGFLFPQDWDKQVEKQSIKPAWQQSAAPRKTLTKYLCISDIRKWINTFQIFTEIFHDRMEEDVLSQAKPHPLV